MTFSSLCFGVTGERLLDEFLLLFIIGFVVLGMRENLMVGPWLLDFLDVFLTSFLTGATPKFTVEFGKGRTSGRVDQRGFSTVEAPAKTLVVVR